MPLGAFPELLTLGYLRCQRLVNSLQENESATADWDVNSAAVKTRHGNDQIERRIAKKIVTTGCGPGSTFGGLMDDIDKLSLPKHSLSQQHHGITDAIRLQETTYKNAGRVHGYALLC